MQAFYRNTGESTEVKCPEFKPSGESTSYGGIKNSCLLCGRTKEAHQPVKQEVHIFFNGRLWKFDTWESAKTHGFYLIP